MAFRNVLVIGGTGFIGSHIIAKLVDADCRVTVSTRREGHATHLLLLPDVEDVVVANVHDDAVLDRRRPEVAPQQCGGIMLRQRSR